MGLTPHRCSSQYLKVERYWGSGPFLVLLGGHKVNFSTNLRFLHTTHSFYPAMKRHQRVQTLQRAKMSATSNLLLQWSAREPHKNLNIWIHRRKHCLIPGKGIRLTLYCSKFLSGEVGGGGEGGSILPFERVYARAFISNLC